MNFGEKVSEEAYIDLQKYTLGTVMFRLSKIKVAEKDQIGSVCKVTSESEEEMANEDENLLDTEAPINGGDIQGESFAEENSEE